MCKWLNVIKISNFNIPFRWIVHRIRNHNRSPSTVVNSLMSRKQFSEHNSALIVDLYFSFSFLQNWNYYTHHLTISYLHFLELRKAPNHGWGEDKFQFNTFTTYIRLPLSIYGKTLLEVGCCISVPNWSNFLNKLTPS